MKNLQKLFWFFSILIFLLIFIFEGCAKSDDSGRNSGGEIDNPGGQPDTGDIVITDVSTDTDGTSTGSATLSTGEEITVTGIGEDAVISIKISKSSSIGFNEENYSAVTDYSLEVNSEDEVSIKIKFKETPNAVMAKDNATEWISYKPFLNNEDGSSQFNMKAGEDISFFPLKNKSLNASSKNFFSMSSSSDSVPKRAIIQKSGDDITVTFDASLNVEDVILDGMDYGDGYMHYMVVYSNSATFTDLENGTYEMVAYERGTGQPIWKQDIFIENRNVSDYVISALAEKFAPILAMNGDEDYFPTSFSVENMFQSSIAPDLYFKLASIKGGDDVSLVNLPEYLATNGHSEAFHSASVEVKNFFKDISGEEHKTVYYSFIQKGNNYYLNYHFLYTYDPKGTKENTGTGNHVFDRESITLVFEDVVDDSSAENFGDPEGIVFGAHLDNQTIKYNGDVEETWKGGRVYVPWQSVKKSENHPVVPVALGSHALYPLCGEYVIFGVGEDVCGDDLSSTKLLLPLSIYDSSLGDSYDLFDLQLGNLDSYSADAFKALMFSGGLVDMLIGSAKFPPFTDGNREIDSEEWVSFDVNYPMNEEKAFYWDISEVDSPLTDAIVEKLDDGIFVDPSTGLTWQDNNYSEGMIGAIAGFRCDALVLAGYSDWRLPTFDELSSLWYKKSELKSYIENFYWSSTNVNCYYSGSEFFYIGARILSFGSTYNPNFCTKKEEGYKFYVRCVRDNQ